MTESRRSTEISILGAGPAGLAAAWELARAGRDDILVIDKNAVPGGLSRTETHEGNRFDVGPHRFFTADREVRSLWHDLLGDEFLPVQRLTRIFYRKRLFRYPLEAVDALKNLGLRESVTSMLSYLLARLKGGVDDAKTFEEWVSGRFGKKLYETFFRTYTEKVWGIPCREIGAEWASQRIRGLDLKAVVTNALLKHRVKAKTLADEFDYPVLGAGMMYERMWERTASTRRELISRAEVVRIRRAGMRITEIEVRTADGNILRVNPAFVFSSIPLTHLLQMLEPAVPDDVGAAVAALYYRDHITVNIVADGADLFPDQWIYVHAPDVKMARLANFTNFSRRMAAKPDSSVISLEYFTFRDDALWRMTDDELKRLAATELASMGFLSPERIRGSFVTRETESYPTYFLGFQDAYATVRAFAMNLENLACIGRAGLYKYNNMDHSIATGLMAARKLIGIAPAGDVWSLNTDEEYQENASRNV
ncbi:MAG TPA: FAD-dependent oxidoreductase [Candidatus Ozemobacteraceae bacterium]|nr:FAD-dependent oxidoreductase [Candidatus Ozemobacteraceae bacterium]